MRGSRRSGSRAYASSSRIKQGSGKKAATTCAACRGDRAMASASAIRSRMSNRPANTPKDAAAVILLRHDTDPLDPEVFWVLRGYRLAFLPGFHAFPGGQIDASDAEVDVRNAPNPETAAMISGAARELFEELGVLAVRGG